MKEYRFLKLLDKFQGIYTKLGVDYEKMRLILSMKLNLDSRKTTTIMNNKKKKDEDKDKNLFFMSLIMYAFMGIFIGALTLTSINMMYTFSISFGMFMFFILSIFISDFSSVLLDVRDKNIIGTKGIDNKTINAAKITHICYYILLTSFALGWLAIIGMFRYGLVTGILFIFEMIIADIFLIVLTALIYLVILRFFDGEKVKDIINFVQIGLTIIMTVGYQFVGRMFRFVDKDIIVYESKVWNLLLPPMWFASPLYAVNGGYINNIIILLIILAFVVPIVSIILYVKNTSKFENLLSKLSIVKNKEKENNKGLLYKIGRYSCSNNEQKAAYDFSVSIIQKDRELKLKLYPSLGLSVIFPILFTFLFSNNDKFSINNLSLSMSLNIYWFIFMIPSLLLILQCSNNYKAAWIYKTAFISDMTNIYKGAYKGFIANIILPLYLVESIIFIICFGVKVVPVLIVAFLFLLVTVVIGHIIGKIKVPFTCKFGLEQSKGSTIAVFIGMGIVALGAVINYFILSNVFLLSCYGVILAGLALFLWKKCIKVY
ncbi:MAG TPA: ABC transporter permease [Clostridium sp.]|nr:ABC transporter permease [Clostridium sp.]